MSPQKERKAINSSKVLDEKVATNFWRVVNLIKKKKNSFNEY
jgi:hypothetical protein